MMGKYFSSDFLPFTAIVSMECANVGLNTLYKAASMRGLNYYVFITYAYALGALILLPSPFITHRSPFYSHIYRLTLKTDKRFTFCRKRLLPQLGFSILYKIGLLGLVGSISQIMGYKGISYASPTLASAISNLTPAFTFILALIFRMEKVDVRSCGSQAKIAGAVVSISGAFVVTLYRGPAIVLTIQSDPRLVSSPQPSWIHGSLFLTAEYLLVPVWYIIQAQIMKEYPAELTVVFFYNLCVAVVASMLSVVSQVGSSSWKLGLDISLLSVLCSGIFGSFLGIVVHTWALRVKGPVYVAMFKPLSIVIAVGMGVILVGDRFHVGSMIGATIISIGFYTVMWGKAKEESESPCIGENAPLLPLQVQA